jgi:SAM-dependent methyltransferase
MKCTICSSEKFKFNFEVTREDNRYAYTDERKKTHPVYFVCSHCEVMMFNDSPEYENIYSDGTYYAVDEEPAAFLERRFNQVISFPEGKSDNLARVKRIKDFLTTQPQFSKPAQRKVLDVGAGMGVFLYKFVDEIWKGTALEPDPNACQFMQKVLKRTDVICGLAADIPLGNHYQLITYNRVLEHIYDPLSALRSIRQYLSDEGILYLELPDVLSYYEDGANNEAFGWGHYMVYSPLSLIMLADRAGFEVVSLSRCVEPSTKFTIYGFFRKKEFKNA